MTLDDLKPGLRHSATLTVNDRLAVPAQAEIFSPGADMPPVFATAQMIAFVEWTCVAALAPYLGPHQRTVGTRVEMTHIAAAPIGTKVTAEVELIAIDGRILRFKAICRDQKEPIGDGFHERTVIDHERFLARLARKRQLYVPRSVIG
jgi:fluoroacetyl-CoA thioesterase